MTTKTPDTKTPMNPWLKKGLTYGTPVATALVAGGAGYYFGKRNGQTQTMAQLNINPKSIGAK